MAVIVPIVGEYQGTAFRRAEQDIEKLGRTARRQASGVSKFGSAFKGAFAGGLIGGGVGAAASAVAGLVTDIGHLAVTFAKDGVQSAMEEEKALAALARQAAATGSSFDPKVISAYVDNLQFATNVTDGELYPALTKLTAATGSLAQAQQILGPAIDAAVGSGKSLDTVTTALAKAANGQTGALKRLFPALDSNVLATGDLVAIQGELNRLYGGAAATAVDTAAGQMANLKIAVDEAAEALGTGLLAGFLGSTNSTDDMVASLRNAQPMLEDFGRSLGTVGSLLKYFSAGVLVATAPMRLFYAALTGNTEAMAAIFTDFGNTAAAVANMESTWTSAAEEVANNPIVGVVAAVDPYGKALGESIAPFSKVIGMIIADIKAAREQAEQEAADSEAAAEAARRRLQAKISAQTATIADRARAQLRSARDEVANFRSITDDFKRGITEFGAVSSLQAEASVPISAEMITANMRQRLAAITAFSTKIKELKTKGLPASVLVDIINQGPFEGLRYAEAILASKTAISDIRSLTAGINRQAGIIGNIGAEATTGTTLGNLQAATSFVVQAGGINITVNGEVSAKTVKEIKNAVRDSLKRVSREAKGSRKPGGRG